MNASTAFGIGGMVSGSRSPGTCTAMNGNGSGREPSGSVNVVPAYTVAERFGIVRNVNVWSVGQFCRTRKVSLSSIRGRWTSTGDTVTWLTTIVYARLTPAYTPGGDVAVDPS